MKKTIHILVLSIFIFSNYSYSQLTSIDNLPITRVFGVYNQDVRDSQNAITVPAGKLWYINNKHGSTDWRIQFPNANWLSLAELGFLLPEGTTLYGVNSSDSILNIIEYDLDGQVLAQNNLELDNKNKLFPNPTNSTITLNSDKDYNIEIFDMSGKLVMKTSGNSIDISTLSNAVYLVKVADKMNNEITSYKIVKN
jgi:hypothetical protein